MKASVGARGSGLIRFFAGVYSEEELLGAGLHDLRSISMDHAVPETVLEGPNRVKGPTKPR